MENNEGGAREMIEKRGKGSTVQIKEEGRKEKKWKRINKGREIN